MKSLENIIEKKSHTALVVDDDSVICSLLTVLLKMEKIQAICAGTVQEADRIIKDNKDIDLFLIDYFLPDGEGPEVVDLIKSIRPNTPIIVISGKSEDVKLPSLVAGANMVIAKPFSEIEFLMIIRNMISLSDAYDRLKDAESIIEALELALEARDTYTEGHGKRVAKFSLDLYDNLGLNDRSQREGLYVGGILHDIGKIGVPDSILKSTERLTPEQYELIKTHPTVGYGICKNLSVIEHALDVVLSHHERLDGSGYPSKLDDGNIPTLAQITAVADVFDALTSKRSYRGEMTLQDAVDVLEKEAGEGKLNKEFVSVFKRITLKENK